MGRPKVDCVHVVCSACGAGIEKYPSQVAQNKTGRFFCSRACLARVGSKPQTIPRRRCEICDAEFVAYGKRAGRFCSTTCQNAWQARNRITRTCEWCAKTFSVQPSFLTRQTARFCSRACYTMAAPKRKAGHLHNGRPAIIDNRGYVRVYEPSHPAAYKNGQVFEHRLVIENFLGRRLRTDEHVHHVNSDKTDNRLENLLVLGHSEHSVLTGKERTEALAAMQSELAEYRRRFGPL